MSECEQGTPPEPGGGPESKPMPDRDRDGDGESRAGSMLGSVSRWIARARVGDRDATVKLWERYAVDLANVAGRRVPTHFRREVSGHDLANDAIAAIMGGLGLGRWPGVRRRNEFWGLLHQTASYHALNAIRKLYRQARHRAPMPPGDIEAEGSRPGEPWERDEAFERLMARLAERDPIYEAIARRLARGQTQEDIARELGCSVRKVGRKLERIAEIVKEEYGR
ncbi:MAG: hypothetical protein K2X91_17365 [Thermoleophilia bacterium]|nr:hypothetical protein [Thermoleophilia bacterium]